MYITDSDIDHDQMIEWMMIPHPPGSLDTGATSYEGFSYDYGYGYDYQNIGCRFTADPLEAWRKLDTVMRRRR